MDTVTLIIIASKLSYGERVDGFDLYGGAALRCNDAGQWFFENSAGGLFLVEVDDLPDVLTRYAAVVEQMRNFCP